MVVAVVRGPHGGDSGEGATWICLDQSQIF